MKATQVPAIAAAFVAGVLCCVGAFALQGDLLSAQKKIEVKERESSAEQGRTPEESKLKDTELGSSEEIAALKPGVVLKVGDIEVSAEDILARAFEAEKLRDPNQQNVRLAYRFYIGSLLLRAEAERLGVEVTDELREKVVNGQVSQTKEQVRRAYGGGISWDDWLRSSGMNEKEFRDRVMASADNIYLKRLMVAHYESTNTSASYHQIRMLSESSASKLHSAIQAKLEANPNERTSIFQTQAALKAEVQGAITITAYEDDALPKPMKDAVFTSLNVEDMSEVIKYSDNDYRIIMLLRRTPGSTLTVEEIAEVVDANLKDREPESFAERFVAWVVRIQNRGTHRVVTRVPELREIREQSKPAKKPIEIDKKKVAQKDSAANESAPKDKAPKESAPKESGDSKE